MRPRPFRRSEAWVRPVALAALVVGEGMMGADIPANLTRLWLEETP